MWNIFLLLHSGKQNQLKKIWFWERVPLRTVLWKPIFFWIASDPFEIPVKRNLNLRRGGMQSVAHWKILQGGGRTHAPFVWGWIPKTAEAARRVTKSPVDATWLLLCAFWCAFNKQECFQVSDYMPFHSHTCQKIKKMAKMSGKINWRK